MSEALGVGDTFTTSASRADESGGVGGTRPMDDPDVSAISGHGSGAVARSDASRDDLRAWLEASILGGPPKAASILEALCACPRGL